MGQLLNNRYQVIQKLGSGGFGETFLAEDTHMPSLRRCVIKQLKPIAKESEVYELVQERFQREAATLEALGANSNQIPSLYAYFYEGGQFYLVQEWIHGLTLTQKVQQQGKLPESQVYTILTSLLHVLDSIHQQQIIHRDIKPDNIILRFDDNLPVLIDFGAVRETMGTQMNSQGHPTRSIVIGTPGFMPSEQAAGRPTYNSDLYSLGLTAIYLLTGKPPQELTTDYETGKILWQPEEYQLNSNLVAAINRAIASHPRDRVPSAQAMLALLQPQDTLPQETQQTLAFGSPLNPTVTPENPAPATPKALSRRWLAVGVGGILSLVAVVLGLQSLQTNNPPSSLGSGIETVPPQTLPDTNPETVLPETVPTDSLPNSTSALVSSERIRFRPGSTSGTVNNSLTPNQIKRYLLRALQGQEFTVEVLQGQVEGVIIAPDNQTLGTTQDGIWRGVLPRTGNYTVALSANEPTAYTVSFAISALEQESDLPANSSGEVITERVKFLPGATAATISGSVDTNRTKRYLLGAGKGQQFIVEVMQGDVEVVVKDPTGAFLGAANRDAVLWEGTLPGDGDYVVDISSPTGSTYTVRLEIF